MSMYQKLNKYTHSLEIVFNILFLTVGFLQTSSITFGAKIISFVQWPMVALGCLLLLFRLFYNKYYRKTPVFWPLMAFIVSYVISMLVNFKYGIYENFRGLIFLVFEFALLYLFNSNTDKAFTKTKFNISTIFYISVVGILSLISLITMFCGVSLIYEQEVGPTIVVGFAWGRLFGVYWDPNIAAVMANLALLLSLLFIKKAKKIFKVLLILNIVVQALYIVFSDSRTGVVGLTASLTIYSLFYLAKYGFKKIKTNLYKSVLIGLSVLLIGFGAFQAPKIIKNTYNKITVYLISAFEVETENNLLISSDGREEDIASDISNRRFDIWGSATQIFKESPIVGASHFNIVNFSKDRIPDTYILTNDHMVFDTMHNVIFDILASQGILGILTFGISALSLVIFVLKNRKKFYDGEDCLLNFTTLAIIGSVLACSMFITEIVFVITPLTLIFWIAAGMLVKNIAD